MSTLHALTADELLRARRAALLKTLAEMAGCLLLAVVTFLSASNWLVCTSPDGAFCSLISTGPRTVTAFVLLARTALLLTCLASCVMLLSAGIRAVASWRTDLQPLSGDSCTLMEQTADLYPQVAGMLGQINAMGRPVVTLDLRQALEWRRKIEVALSQVADQEHRQWMAERNQRARLSINAFALTPSARTTLAGAGPVEQAADPAVQAMGAAELQAIKRRKGLEVCRWLGMFALMFAVIGGALLHARDLGHGSGVIVPTLAVTVAFVLAASAWFVRGWLICAKPMHGRGCLEMENLGLAHPQVAHLLCQINASGREVTPLDLDQARNWDHQKRRADAAAAREKQAERQRASCRTINGLGS